MAEYHVGCGAFGIYAGTLEPKNKICGEIKQMLLMKPSKLLEIGLF